MKTKVYKRDKIAKITSRIALIVMCFMLIIPLCSMAEGTTETIVNIENTGNLPQDLVFSDQMRGRTMHFGQNFIPVSSATIIDGVFSNLGPNILDVVLDPIYDGNYYYTALHCKLDDTTDSYSVIDNGTVIYQTETRDYFNSQSAVFYFVIMNSDIVDIDIAEPKDLDAEFQYYYLLFPITEPTPTTPILDVWTVITNWITSSLASVQGVFFIGSTGTPVSTILDMNDSIVYDGTTFYKASSSDVHQFYFNGILVEFGNDNIITSGNLTIVYSDGIPLFVVNTDAEVYYVANNSALTLTPSSPPHLTFLGTITIIGVSIACAFLIIGIIQRFLKLRG